jgi:hypothetical protein
MNCPPNNDNNNTNNDTAVAEDEDQDDDDNADDADEDASIILTPVDMEQNCTEAMTLLQNRVNFPSWLHDRIMVHFTHKFVRNVKIISTGDGNHHLLWS